ncbi:LuxR family transcriptional regulator [Methylobacterium sp. BTF04]|uniref:helix-turn-helix transcriptional regulator n=1 Tax=Methylobacterium sp. BTF04 TaxID=2708300 RepID=UPI0013D7E0B7|nr:LuxR family transcriptional regulator [Methylobacterium sp. BTF04]NEU13853.1 LuxR family transcriptional regulator [Methylobacterium sp. BTF04]
MLACDPGPLIELCYAAALDESLWPRVLAALSSALGAQGSVIVSLDPNRTASTIHSESLAEAQAAYQTAWWRFDTRIAKAKAIGLKPGAVARDGDLLTNDERRRDPFFQEFCCQHDLGDFAGYMALDPVDKTLFTFGAFRSLRDGDYSALQITQFECLAPHVVRAHTLARTLRKARQDVADLELGLERMRFGMVSLDRQGCVSRINALAERMIAPCLRLAADRSLRAIVGGEQAKLDRLIVAALQPIRAAASPILLRCTDEKPPVLVEAVPLTAEAASTARTGARDGGALLLMRDLFGGATCSVTPQLEQLGLSGAEARIAMLVGRGHAPREAARILGVAEGTARVHLRAIFAKLDISRQSELAILVTRLEACSHA